MTSSHGDLETAAVNRRNALKLICDLCFKYVLRPYCIL